MGPTYILQRDTDPTIISYATPAWDCGVKKTKTRGLDGLDQFDSVRLSSHEFEQVGSYIGSFRILNRIGSSTVRLFRVYVISGQVGSITKYLVLNYFRFQIET
jgi:hypothetical protein